MAWIESPYRKKRTRYYKSKVNELVYLNIKWTNELKKLGFGNALDRDSTAYQGGRTNGMLLSYYEIHNPAWEYAENKAASSLTWYQSLVSGNGGKIIAAFFIAITLAVASFICPPVAVFGVVIFGAMSGAFLAVAIISATAAFIGASAARYHSYKASGLGGLAMFVQSKTAFLREKSTKEQQSYALTLFCLKSLWLWILRFKCPLSTSFNEPFLRRKVAGRKGFQLSLKGLFWFSKARVVMFLVAFPTSPKSSLHAVRAKNKLFCAPHAADFYVKVKR